MMFFLFVFAVIALLGSISGVSSWTPLFALKLPLSHLLKVKLNSIKSVVHFVIFNIELLQMGELVIAT